MRILCFALYVCLWSGQVLAFYEQPCAKVYSVPEVIARARQLKGKVICVGGEVSLKIADDGSTRATYEIKSERIPGKPKNRQARIGFVDASMTEGALASQYRPESFELLDVGPSLTGVRANSEYVLQVQVKGVFVVGKQIQKSIADRLPGNYPIRASDLKHNHFELLMLEVLNARLLNQAP